MLGLWKITEKKLENEKKDLVLKIGFDSSGLYDIGQEKGYGAAHNMWMTESMNRFKKWLNKIFY